EYPSPTIGNRHTNFIPPQTSQTANSASSEAKNVKAMADAATAGHECRANIAIPRLAKLKVTIANMCATLQTQISSNEIGLLTTVWASSQAMSFSSVIGSVSAELSIMAEGLRSKSQSSLH